MTFMDAHHIQMQLLSFPMPLNAETARRFNDYATSVVAIHPDRFGMLATSPWATRTRTRHSAKSTGPPTGDPSFEPVFAALSQRQATAFIHPVNPRRIRPGQLRPSRPADRVPDGHGTHRGRRHLGGCHRTPPRDMNLVLAHAASCPYWHHASLTSHPWTGCPTRPEGSPTTSSGNSWAGSTARPRSPAPDSTMKPLLEMTDPSHIIFGTDYPAAAPV